MPPPHILADIVRTAALVALPPPELVDLSSTDITSKPAALSSSCQLAGTVGVTSASSSLRVSSKRMEVCPV